jgi:hypothetical protein
LRGCESAGAALHALAAFFAAAGLSSCYSVNMNDIYKTYTYAYAVARLGSTTFDGVGSSAQENAAFLLGLEDGRIPRPPKTVSEVHHRVQELAA